MGQFELLIPTYLGPDVATPVLREIKKRYGVKGLKFDAPFSNSVSWAPTIQVQTSNEGLVLVEVSEGLYPAIFNSAYAEILNEEPNRAIKVYQVCPLSSFQADKRQEKSRKLKKHGFGLMTVDDVGTVIEQFAASVLIHHIPPSRFDELTKGMPADTRSPLIRAFDVYQTDGRQGLQLASQIVEALIHLIASQCLAKQLLGKYNPSAKAANVIDALYNSTHQSLIQQRACFGGVRNFMKYSRNAASHPAKSPAQAGGNVTAVREGFDTAMRVCSEMCKARKALQLNKRLTV